MTGNRKQKTSAKKYRYVVAVQETVESTATIDSDRKMSWQELRDEAERRRVNGSLSFRAVKDVDMWCEAAYAGKRQIGSLS